MLTAFVRCVVLVVLACAACAIASAADSLSAKAAIFQDPVTTSHSVVIDGQRVEYQATAGHLTMLKEDGKIGRAHV